MTSDIATFFKGFAMGAANVIPGVSGGTVAFITGIYERLINALKSCDVTAIKLLLKFKLREFATHVDLRFLAALGIGAVVSILTLAKLLEHLFEHHPTLVWAFFFGLILGSIYFVGKMVKNWDTGPTIMLLIGTAIAVVIALLTPATESRNFVYLILCGVVAICSMIIPGLSGSFVLLLMGNYMLVLGSISDLFSGLKSFEFGGPFAEALKIIIPIGIGAAIGLIAFSHLLAWVFKNHHDRAVALLTGFVLGSLLIIWPWKLEQYLLDENGSIVLRDGEPVPVGYSWFLPDLTVGATWGAIGLIVLGLLAVWWMEKAGAGTEGLAENGDQDSTPDVAEEH